MADLSQTLRRLVCTSGADPGGGWGGGAKDARSPLRSGSRAGRKGPGSSRGFFMLSRAI